MDAATARTEADRDVLVRETERRSARQAAGVTIRIVRTVGMWYWAIYVIIGVAVIVGLTRFGPGMDQSFLDAQTGSPTRWFVLVLGVIVPAAYLRMHVAAGGTRRALARGTIRGAIVCGALFGVVTGLYLIGEHALFDALDLTWSRELGLPVDGFAGVALTVVTETLTITTYYLVGAAISAGFYRFGMARGIAYFVATLVPVALVDLATHTGIATVVVGPAALPDGGAGILLALVGGLAAIAVAAWLFSTPLGSISLRPAL